VYILQRNCELRISNCGLTGASARLFQLSLNRPAHRNVELDVDLDELQFDASSMSSSRSTQVLTAGKGAIDL
jgi:hypothetical protein